MKRFVREKKLIMIFEKIAANIKGTFSVKCTD